MTSQRADGFTALLEVLDRRARRFGPDRTAMWGVYDWFPPLPFDTFGVLLDTGQLVPNPVIQVGVTIGNRYPCVWMQGGHDVLVLAVSGGDD